MDRRPIVAALLAAAVATAVACGVRPPRAEQAAAFPAFDAARHAAAAHSAAHPGAKRAAPARRPVADTVDAELVVAANTRAARFELAVFNTADRRVEVNFPDGRTRDFAVYDAAGREVWRWSRGRLFTQVMQNKPIAAHDSTRYAEEWKAPAPGRYTVVAELRSENHPLRRAAAFVVPAPIPAGAVAQAGADPAVARAVTP
jgi:hypothetical protein